MSDRIEGVPAPLISNSGEGSASRAEAAVSPLIVIWRDNGEALITTRKYPDDEGRHGPQVWPCGVGGYYLKRAEFCRAPIFHPSALPHLPGQLKEAATLRADKAEGPRPAESESSGPVDLTVYATLSQVREENKVLREACRAGHDAINVSITPGSPVSISLQEITDIRDQMARALASVSVEGAR